MSGMMLLLVVYLSVIMPAAAMADGGDAALMKACPGLAVWAADHPRSGKRTVQEDAGKHVGEPALRAELARRSANDQRVRVALIAAGDGNGAPGKEAAAVDSDNLRWLKAVVGKQGLPTVEQVGESGVRDAWLLVQHADSDPAFQASALEKSRPLLAAGEISRREFAMLTDRVLRNQGKRQRYGSQFSPAKDGILEPEPIEDMAHVEQRRAAMDLMPLPVYGCMVRFSLAPPPATASRAPEGPQSGSAESR